MLGKALNTGEELDTGSLIGQTFLVVVRKGENGGTFVEALTLAIATALAEHQQCLISLYPAPTVVNSDVLAVNSSEILTDEEFERELMGM